MATFGRGSGDDLRAPRARHLPADRSPSPAGAIRQLAGALALPLLFLLAAGCASIRRPDPPVDRSRDGAILAEVRARLDSEPAVDASRIRVEVEGGVVRLHGSVDGVTLWRCVIRNAELVDGVVSVVEFLVIDRGPRDARCVAARREPARPGPRSASPDSREGAAASPNDLPNVQP